MRTCLVAASLVVMTFATPALATPRMRLEGVVNVNTASADELQLLPGVGPAKVRNIVAYRTKHRFRTIEELVRIRGIGRKMFRRLRLNLAVTGPTTVQQVIRADPPPAVPLPEPPPLLRRPIPALPFRPPAPPRLPRLVPRVAAFPIAGAGASHCTRGP